MSSATNSPNSGASATPASQTSSATNATPVSKASPATKAAASKFEDPSKYKWTNSVGEETSWAEWHARRRCGLCSWCGFESHTTTMCPLQWAAKKAEQMVAEGNQCLGYEKARRREARLCIYCGAKGHMQKACLKQTRAQLAAKEARRRCGRGEIHSDCRSQQGNVVGWHERAWAPWKVREATAWAFVPCQHHLAVRCTYTDHHEVPDRSRVAHAASWP